MKDYINYLKANHKLTKKKAHFYGLWVKKFIKFAPEKAAKELKNDDIKYYINYLINSHQDWQIIQAREAFQ